MMLAPHMPYVVESVLFHGPITEAAMQIDSRRSAPGAIDNGHYTGGSHWYLYNRGIHRRETLTFDDSYLRRRARHYSESDGYMIVEAISARERR